MFPSKKALVQILVLLCALGSTPKLLTRFAIDPVLAQSPPQNPSFPLPKSLPPGTTMKVDGSKSMRTINQALKKRYEQKFSGTKVSLGTGGTDRALAALQKGEIDLAAVGRPLTKQEQQQGLVSVPLSREKIAIIVGSNNPFKGNLSSDQFVKIFRGEIKDWSQVGGPKGAIRFIDHPNSSDTRRSFSNYDIFKKGAFKTGNNATQLSQEGTTAIVRALGKDGISYAIADQAIGLKNVRVVPFNKTLPTDPRYPYSQPRGYVYKKVKPKPAVIGFLGFATSKPGQEIVKAAKKQEIEEVRKSTAAIAPSAGQSPQAAVPAPAGHIGATTGVGTQRLIPWWLLLLGIPLLGGLLWWLLRGDESRPAPTGSAEGATPASGGTAPATTAPGTIGATGSATPAPGTIGATGSATPTPGIIGVTGSATPTHGMNGAAGSATPTHGMNGTGAGAGSGVHILGTNGAVATAGSAVTASEIAGGIAGVAAALVAGAAAWKKRSQNSQITLVGRYPQQVYASWEVPQADRDAAKEHGGQQFQLRIYDVTLIDLDTQRPHRIQAYSCNEQTKDRQVLVPGGDRDYLASIGYITENGEWLELARSKHVRVPSFTGVAEQVGAVAAGTTVGIVQAAKQTAAQLENRVVRREGCKIQHLRVHSRDNSFLLDAERMKNIQQTGVSKTLEPGIHVVRIKSGGFGYDSNINQFGEPVVVLWIYGGMVINKKTNVPVAATWSTLNGYNDTLTLEVLEISTLCAFFFDSYIADNNGEVTISVARLYSK